MSSRREFITLLGGAAASWPLAVRAQGERMRRVGVLIGGASTDSVFRAQSAAFLQGLQQLGWTDGVNVRIDYRWGAGNADAIRKYSAELVALAPDVILVSGTASVGPLLQVAGTISVVFVNLPDPVGAGYVKSLGRPGGNVTGFTNFEYGLSAKWLQLLKEVAPGVTRAAVLRDPALTAGTAQFAAVQTAAASLGIEQPGRCALCPRDRIRSPGLRAVPEWWADRDAERIGPCPSQTYPHAGHPTQAACSPCQSTLGGRRRFDLLWSQCGR
jgi:putative ABC transport system substrate-binding protein